MRNAFHRDLNFSSTENNELVTNCDRFNKLIHSNALMSKGFAALHIVIELMV